MGDPGQQVTPLPATRGSDVQDVLDKAAACCAARHSTPFASAARHARLAHECPWRIFVYVAAPVSGAVAREALAPWGTVRRGGVPQTTLNDTGQRLDGTGLL